MNHFQKLRYIALGGILTMIGVLIGTLISSSLQAEGSGGLHSFDAISCGTIWVRDEIRTKSIQVSENLVGPGMISLESEGLDAGMVIRNMLGNTVVSLQNDNADRLAHGTLNLNNNSGEPTTTMGTDVFGDGEITLFAHADKWKTDVIGMGIAETVPTTRINASSGIGKVK